MGTTASQPIAISCFLHVTQRDNKGGEEATSCSADGETVTIIGRHVCRTNSTDDMKTLVEVNRAGTRTA